MRRRRMCVICAQPTLSVGPLGCVVLTPVLAAVLDMLTGDDPIDPNTANADGLTALHQACIENRLVDQRSSSADNCCAYFVNTGAATFEITCVAAPSS